MCWDNSDCTYHISQEMYIMFLACNVAARCTWFLKKLGGILLLTLKLILTVNTLLLVFLLLNLWYSYYEVWQWMPYCSDILITKSLVYLLLSLTVDALLLAFLLHVLSLDSGCLTAGILIDLLQLKSIRNLLLHIKLWWEHPTLLIFSSVKWCQLPQRRNVEGR